MKRKMLWGLIALVGAAVVASAAVPAWKSLGRVGAGSDVPLFTVERGDFLRLVHAEGNLEAVDATRLGPPAEVSQPLKIAWLAPDGTAVREGQVVIRFDPTDMERDLRDGRHDRATTDSRITQKKVRDEGSRRNLTRDAELAGLELEYTSEFQSKDAAIFSRTDIIESEIDRELAQKKKDHAEQASVIRHALSQAELDLLNIERRKAELKIDQAEKGLRGLEVQAPHDGIFVLKEVWGRRPEVGQMVWGGNAVAELPKLKKMQAQVHVLEADAGGLEVGLPATVVLDARPEVVYEGRIKSVSALAQRRNRNSPVQYFGVTVELDRTEPESMKPGQRVQSTISLESRENVISVPRQAVFDEEGKKIVYVATRGGFEPREVELGPATVGRLVIESGLAEGDQVALRDPTRPADDAGSDDSDPEPSSVTP